MLNLLLLKYLYNKGGLDNKICIWTLKQKKNNEDFLELLNIFQTKKSQYSMISPKNIF